MLKTSCSVSCLEQVDNQSKLKRKDTLSFNSRQILVDLDLPEGFTIGKAIGRGDCFFHAVAQGLKHLKPDMNFTVKHLRDVCKAFAQSQLNPDSSWLTRALKNDGRNISYYISRIEFTADDIKKGSEILAMWGLPEIEGRIICITYNVRLHFIEVTINCDKENVVTHHIIDKEGYQKDILNREIVNKEVYYRKDTIHIINKGSFHFEPILRGTAQQMLPYYCMTMANEKESDSESVCFQQISEVKMMDYEHYKESSSDVEVLPAKSTIGAIVDYEDRSSNEELQYKQNCEFQEGPINSKVAGSSTSKDISNSVWYSVLTGCRLTVGTDNNVSPTADEIVKRATFFVKTFVKEFEEKLFQYSEEAKPGSKIRKPGKTIDQSVSIVSSFIPPSWMRLGCSKAIGGIGYFFARKHKQRAKKASMAVMSFEGEVRESLVEAGLEIFQKFEKQFTKAVDVNQPSWKRGIEKLAIDAVHRVMNYISVSNETEETPLVYLTQGVILGKSKRNLKHCGYQVKGKQNGKILMTSELYGGVGIVKIDGDITEYYQSREHDCTEKYGYRLPFAWELEKWWEVNKKYTLINPPKKEEYMPILDEEKKKELADNILKKINRNDLTKRKDIEELYEKIENLRVKKEESIRPFLFNLDNLPQFFVERGNMLKVLNEKLNIKRQGEKRLQTTLIHGGYGAGKSELAKSYAHSVKRDGNVVWINAKSCSTLSNSFYSVARKLGIPTEGYKGIQKINSDMKGKKQVDYYDIQKKNIESIVNNVYEKLQDVESYFIFDNASQYEEIRRFLPPYGFIFGGKQPYVLITSCNEDWKEEIEKINLNKGFSPAEALMFIEKALGIEDNSHSQIYEMVKLAQRVKYFPLALKQATAYIKQEGCSIDEYLGYYNEAMQKSKLDHLVGQSISKELFTALEVTLDQIKKEKKQVYDVLGSMAYLNHNHIDIERIFLQEKSEKDKQHILDSLISLKSLKMIELQKEIAKIHMGIQETIRIKKEEEGTEEETLREVTTSLLNNSLIDVNHILSIWGHASKYSKLVNEFIDSTYDGGTILHLLAKDGNKEVIKLILEKIDLNKLSKVVNAVDKMKCTPLDCAAMHGHLEIVKYFIEKGSDLDGDNRDLTPLHWATVCGQLEIVKHFIDNKYWEIDELSGEGGAPLHYAVINGNIDIVRYLIEKGADVDLQDEGAGSLHYAIEENRLDIVRYLVEKGAGINLHDKNGKGPLHYAVINGNINVVKYLIEKGADVNLQDKGGMSALHFAVQNGCLDIVCYLIIHGADVDLRSRDNCTSLYFATIVLGFLGQEVDVNMKSKGGMSPLHFTTKSDRLDIIDYLVKKNASVNLCNKSGMSPVYYATIYGQLDIVKYLIMQKTMVDSRNKGGMAPLHFAVIYGYPDIIHYLVGKGANVNLQDKDGMTPLHFAVIYDRSDVISYLIRKGANVNAQNKEGVGPLHLAVVHAHVGSVKYLVGKGADINLQDKDSMTPLYYAFTITIGCSDIIDYLTKYSSLGRGVSMKPELKNLLHNHASGVIRCPETQSLASDLRIQLHKRCHERSTYFSKSKKRKLENINATFKENTSNIQLFQSSQNLPLDISMRREDLFDRTENMVNVTNKMPMFSFNSVAAEPVNNDNLRR